MRSKLTKEGIKFDGEQVLDTLIDFANFTTEDNLDKELEKLKLFKLNDDKPLSTDDLFDIISINLITN